MENTIPPMYNNAITEFDRKYTSRFVPKVIQSEKGFLPEFLRGYFEEQATSTCLAPLLDLADCLPYPNNTDCEERFQCAGTITGLIQDAASIGIALAYAGSRIAGLFNPESNSLANHIQSDPFLSTLNGLLYAKLAGQTGSLIYSAAKKLKSGDKK